MIDYFKLALDKMNINYEEKFLADMQKYLELLLDYNSHTNITAIRDEKDIIEKHFCDSLLLQSLIKKEDKYAIDIGTGAGFPGLVLAIYNRDINFTLLDSVKKKTNFLELVKKELHLENIEIINKRAEEFIREDSEDLKLREKYDLGFCRGVANLSVILEYEIPFIKVGGRFLPQKLSTTDELENSNNALKILKSKFIKNHIFKLPFSKEDRLIIEIKKIEKTDKKYPRKVGKAIKNPL